METPSPADHFLSPFQERKNVIKDNLYSYLKKKREAETVSESKNKNTGRDSQDKEVIDAVFVHQLLSNTEKLHFYAHVELLRLDFRLALDAATSPSEETQPVKEELLEQAAQIEADLTELLTSIGSLHHVDRPPHWSNKVDDALRLLAAWFVFCSAALLFPVPFMLLKGVSRISAIDFYTPAALRFNQMICQLIVQISALKVELSDERTPEGLELMSSHRSVTCYNHTSTIDAFVLPSVSTHFSYMLAKKELFALPFFSWLIAVFGGIPIDRKDRVSAVMSLELAASSVRRGQTVSISPEGTRSTTGLLLPFKKGPFYLWEAMHHHQQTGSDSGSKAGTSNGKEGCLVQPVLITGAFALFPPESLFSAPGVAQVRLLEPIRPSELPPTKSTEEAGSPAALARDRDAMSALLRRRLLQASLSPTITAGHLLTSPAASPGATPRTTLTPTERALSLVTLGLTLVLSVLFFRSLHSSLHSSPPSGLGLSNGQIASWGSGVSVGITVAIFVYYSLKLKRAKRRGADVDKKRKEE